MHLSGSSHTCKIDMSMSKQKANPQDLYLSNMVCHKGQTLGPYLFNIYMKPLADILSEHEIEFDVCTDDQQLYLAFHPIDQDSADVAVNTIQIFMVEVKQWMVQNMSKLNDDKTEFIVIGSRQQRSKIDFPHININGIDITPTSTVHNLGIMFDGEMNLKAHVRAIKPFLDLEAANTAAHAFVSSHLDAENSIFYGIAQGRLQCI